MDLEWNLVRKPFELEARGTAPGQPYEPLLTFGVPAKVVPLDTSKPEADLTPRVLMGPPCPTRAPLGVVGARRCPLGTLHGCAGIVGPHCRWTLALCESQRHDSGSAEPENGTGDDPGEEQ